MVGLSSAQGLTINLWTNHWYYHSQHTCLCIPAATTVYIPMLQPMSEEKCFNQISGIHIVWVKKEKHWKSSPRRTASRYLLRTLTTFLTIFVSHPPWLWQGMGQTRDGLAFGKQIYVSALYVTLHHYFSAALAALYPTLSVGQKVTATLEFWHK